MGFHKHCHAHGKGCKDKAVQQNPKPEHKIHRQKNSEQTACQKDYACGEQGSCHSCKHFPCNICKIIYGGCLKLFKKRKKRKKGSRGKRGHILKIQYSLFYFIQLALNPLILCYFLFNPIIGHCYCHTGHIAEIHTTSSFHVMPL